MGKTGVWGIDFKPEGEVRLWQDDDTGEYSLSIDAPYDGFDAKQVKSLASFLEYSYARMTRKKTKKAKKRATSRRDNAKET